VFLKNLLHWLFLLAAVHHLVARPTDTDPSLVRSCHFWLVSSQSPLLGWSHVLDACFSRESPPAGIP
jgi:hypothetical protein